MLVIRGASFQHVKNQQKPEEVTSEIVLPCYESELLITVADCFRFEKGNRAVCKHDKISISVKFSIENKGKLVERL